MEIDKLTIEFKEGCYKKLKEGRKVLEWFINNRLEKDKLKNLKKIVIECPDEKYRNEKTFVRRIIFQIILEEWEKTFNH